MIAAFVFAFVLVVGAYAVGVWLGPVAFFVWVVVGVFVGICLLDHVWSHRG